MAGGVYSERFILTNTPGIPYKTYAVPNGKRAVVKSIFAFNGGASAGTASLLLGGTNIWAASIPGNNGSVSPAVMVVIYAGEVLGLYVGSAGMSAMACGFLLDTGPA